MANFDTYGNKLWRLEGGYVDHPNDRGGATNRGITLSTYKRACGLDKTIEDLKNMTYEEWRHITKVLYWDLMSADNIANQSIAEICVDWLYNSGPIAIRKIQSIIGVKPDGVVGNMTLTALNSLDQASLHSRLKDARKQFYIGIIQRSPSQKVFMAGWMKRLESFIFDGK